MGRRNQHTTTTSGDAVVEQLRVLAWEHARATGGHPVATPFEADIGPGARRAQTLALLAAVTDLEAALAVVKADAVAAAGHAGARHGDVADALGITRQAVSSRWWRHLASHPGRPTPRSPRVDTDDSARRMRQRERFLAARHELRALLDVASTLPEPRIARPVSAPPAPTSPPDVDGRLF